MHNIYSDWYQLDLNFNSLFIISCYTFQEQEYDPEGPPRPPSSVGTQPKVLIYKSHILGTHFKVSLLPGSFNINV